MHRQYWRKDDDPHGPKLTGDKGQGDPTEASGLQRLFFQPIVKPSGEEADRAARRPGLSRPLLQHEETLPSEGFGLSRAKKEKFFSNAGCQN